MEESYTGFKDLFTSNSIISSERASKYLSAAAFRARIFERQSRNMPGMQMINAVYASCELVCITPSGIMGPLGNKKDAARSSQSSGRHPAVLLSYFLWIRGGLRTHRACPWSQRNHSSNPWKMHWPCSWNPPSGLSFVRPLCVGSFCLHFEWYRFRKRLACHWRMIIRQILRNRIEKQGKQINITKISRQILQETEEDFLLQFQSSEAGSHLWGKKSPAPQCRGSKRSFCYADSEAVRVLTVLAHEINVIAPAILEKCANLVHYVLLLLPCGEPNPIYLRGCSLFSWHYEWYRFQRGMSCQRQWKSRQKLRVRMIYVGIIRWQAEKTSQNLQRPPVCSMQRCFRTIRKLGQERKQKAAPGSCEEPGAALSGSQPLSWPCCNLMCRTFAGITGEACTRRTFPWSLHTQTSSLWKTWIPLSSLCSPFVCLLCHPEHLVPSDNDDDTAYERRLHAMKEIK